MSAAALTDGVYAAAAIAAVWLGLLRARGVLPPGTAGWAWKAGLGAAAGLLALFPVGGVAFWRWGLGIFPNPSIPILCLIGAALLARLSGLQLLSERDRRDAWWLGASVGCILYPHAWGLWSFDLYFWGWRRELWIWGLALLIVALALAGRRTAVLVLLALIAYTLDLLESDNGWDYLLDPVYWLVASGVLLRAAAVKWFGLRPPGGTRAPETERDGPQ